MEKKILVACGTGIATSTVVVKKIEEKLATHNIKYKIIQCKISEVPSLARGVDLIVTTTILRGIEGIPIIQSTSFLTGIGMEADLEKIVAILTQ